MSTIWSILSLSAPTGVHFRRVGKVGGSYEAAVERTVSLLLTWQERARQRHALALLNDRMLCDIGLTRAEAEAEASKPFWRR